MIKASDLRIGNWIYMPNNIIGKVGYEVIRALIVLPEKPNYKPIPLTEDILLKCGFDICWLEKDNEKYYVIIKSKKVYLKFVHSLQNMYFCIEQKEMICENI